MAYFILVTLYFGEYASHVVTTHYVTPPIDSMDQLYDNDLKWVSSFEATTRRWESYFGHIPNFRDRHVWVEPGNSTAEPWSVAALRKVAENPDNMVYFFPAAGAKFRIDKYDIKPPDGRKWYYSKESFVSGSSCDYFRNDYFGKGAFNKKIMLMQAMDMDRLISRDYDRSSDIKSGFRKGEEEKGITFEDKLDLITMEHFKAAVVIALVIYGVCIIILTAEFVMYKIIVMKAEKQNKIAKEIELKKRKEEKEKREEREEKETNSNERENKAEDSKENIEKEVNNGKKICEKEINADATKEKDEGGKKTDDDQSNTGKDKAEIKVKVNDDLVVVDIE